MLDLSYKHKPFITTVKDGSIFFFFFLIYLRLQLERKMLDVIFSHVSQWWNYH